MADKTFTQEEVDAIVKKRLDRERNKKQDKAPEVDAAADTDPKDQPEDNTSTEPSEAPSKAPEDAAEGTPEVEPVIDPSEELKAEIEALKAQNQRLEAERADSLVIYAKDRMRWYMPSMFDPNDVNCLGSEDELMPFVDLTSKESIDKSLEQLSIFIGNIVQFHADRIRKGYGAVGSEQQKIQSIFHKAR